MIVEAYKFIRFDKAKSIGVTVGILISTFLIGQQVGIFSFLTGLMSALADNTNAEIWVIDSKTEDVNSLGRLDERKAREIKSIPGVLDAYPIVIAGGLAEFANGSSANVQLIGSDGPLFVAGPAPARILEGSLRALQGEGAVSADLFDASTLGGSTAVGTNFEINGKRAVIAVQTENVRGFGASLLYTTKERARYFGNLGDNVISAVAVRVAPGYQAAEVKDRINRQIYGIRAWETDVLAATTVQTILASSGIGASTGTLIVFAVISGFFIIGLTMYSAALDRIKDYGTLKAIGASNGYLRRLILWQATLFAIVGFSLAMLCLEGFRSGARSTGLVFSFDWTIIGGIFLLTLLIALSAASFALRRVISLEPAAVFR